MISKQKGNTFNKPFNTKRASDNHGNEARYIQGISDLGFVPTSDYLILRDFPPIDEIWPGFALGEVGALIAAGATGKSMWMLQKSVEIATGYSNNISQGAVLYLAGEDPLSQIAKRLKTISSEYLITDCEKMGLLSDNLHIVHLNEPNKKLFQIDDGKDFFQKNITSLLHQYEDIFKCRFKLVVLDTLRVFHKYSENDDVSSRMIIDTLREICYMHNISVMFLHHTNKVSTMQGNSDMMQAARGSTVLSDNIKYQINLVGMTKEETKRYEDISYRNEKYYRLREEDRRNYIKEVVTKQNFGKIPDDKWLKRGEGGILFNATELRECEYEKFPKAKKRFS